MTSAQVGLEAIRLYTERRHRSMDRTSAFISCSLSKCGKPTLKSLHWPLVKDATSASTSF
jgi:hypothetical protein